jgi:hypothetical protein
LALAGKEHFAHPTLGTDIVLQVKGERFDREYKLKLAGSAGPANIGVPPINLDEYLGERRNPSDEEILEALDLQFGNLLHTPAASTQTLGDK